MKDNLYSYGGNILRVNLSNKQSTKEPIDIQMVKDYIGGRGFAAKILFTELKKGIDPLGPENKLVMASGPLAGTSVPAGGKTTFAAKSPATHSYGDSNVGGHLASEMKYAGYDAIVFEGCSDKPVYVSIVDDEVKFNDASHLWGKGALTCEKVLKDELGEEFQIATIGPAGENKVFYGCISHDFGRQAGRTGVGAVMGSKNLKAIAIKGTKSIKVKDIDKFYELTKACFKDCFQHPNLPLWQAQGTASVVKWSNEVGTFPTRNFSTGFFNGHNNIDGDSMLAKTIVTNKACFGCPMACGKYAKTKYGDKEYFVEGPEYETAAMIGGNYAINDIYNLTYANWLCDELGLDTISTGNVISFVAECLEKNIINKDMVNGWDIKFGDIESFCKMAEAIAYRKGNMADMLANGAKFAAEQIGGDALKIAMQVKGLEFSGYESRNAPAMLLAYMTCDIGAHHNRAWAVTNDIALGRDKIAGKAAEVIKLQHIRPMFDQLATCRLQWVELEIQPPRYAEFLSCATGDEITYDDLLKSSERVWNLTRAFLVREKDDFGKHYDYPPARIFEEPVPDGPTKDKLITKEKVDQLLDDYYKLRKWTKDGVPTAEKLEELNLGFAVDELKGLGKL